MCELNSLCDLSFSFKNDDDFGEVYSQIKGSLMFHLNIIYRIRSKPGKYSKLENC